MSAEVAKLAACESGTSVELLAGAASQSLTLESPLKEVQSVVHVSTNISVGTFGNDIVCSSASS